MNRAEKARDWAANIRALLNFLVMWALVLAAFLPTKPLAITAAIVVGVLAVVRERLLYVAELWETEDLLHALGGGRS